MSVGQMSKQHPIDIPRRAPNKETVLDNPLAFIGRKGGWSRYKAFTLVEPNLVDGDTFFAPHHNSYGQIWTAIRYGLYPWSQKFSMPRFILDIFSGTIVWQNYNKEDELTYYYGDYGKHYRD